MKSLLFILMICRAAYSQEADMLLIEGSRGRVFVSRDVAQIRIIKDRLARQHFQEGLPFNYYAIFFANGKEFYVSELLTRKGKVEFPDTQLNKLLQPAIDSLLQSNCYKYKVMIPKTFRPSVALSYMKRIGIETFTFSDDVDSILPHFTIKCSLRISLPRNRLERELKEEKNKQDVIDLIKSSARLIRRSVRVIHEDSLTYWISDSDGLTAADQLKWTFWLPFDTDLTLVRKIQLSENVSVDVIRPPRDYFLRIASTDQQEHIKEYIRRQWMFMSVTKDE